MNNIYIQNIGSPKRLKRIFFSSIVRDSNVYFKCIFQKCSKIALIKLCCHSFWESYIFKILYWLSTQNWSFSFFFSFVEARSLKKKLNTSIIKINRIMAKEKSWHTFFPHHLKCYFIYENRDHIQVEDGVL